MLAPIPAEATIAALEKVASIPLCEESLVERATMELCAV